jgi:hypothetical protein
VANIKKNKIITRGIVLAGTAFASISIWAAVVNQQVDSNSSNAIESFPVSAAPVALNPGNYFSFFQLPSSQNQSNEKTIAPTVPGGNLGMQSSDVISSMPPQITNSTSPPATVSIEMLPTATTPGQSSAVVSQPPAPSFTPPPVVAVQPSPDSQPAPVPARTPKLKTRGS